MCGLSVIVGGNWNNAAISGVFAMNLNNVRSNSNDNIGGRDFNSLPDTTMVDTGVIGVCCPAISEIKKDTSLSSRLNLESQGVSQKSKRVGFLCEKAFTR